MKTIGRFLAVQLAVIAFVGQPAAHVSAVDTTAIAGPFSPRELASFRALGPIDTHTHVFAADPAFITMLKKLNLHILDILVVDDMEPGHSDLDKQRQDATSVVRASDGFVVLCTSFDPFSFRQPNYTQTVIRGLNQDFANGAIAVKIWKNVGMEI